MKLAINIGMSGDQLNVPVKKILRAEQLGYYQVWTMESWGSDAVTPLAYLAALTTRITLCTGIMQIPARTPAMTAMTAATLDSLAGGNRVIAGLGVSGPQVAEGWYGQPWEKPYWKIRDYVTIMRKIFKREGPVTHQGREFQLPYKGEGAMGIGKPLQSMLHPNPDIPKLVPHSARPPKQALGPWSRILGEFVSLLSAGAVWRGPAAIRTQHRPLPQR